MKRKQHEIEQERYANMRLKKERSRRTKFHKSLSGEFNKVKDHPRLSPMEDSEMYSEGSSYQESIAAAIYSETPNAYRSLRTIGSTDEDSPSYTSQPGELFEC
jgi:hypothetical protein